jgi:large subunit ribosomal protein L10
MAQKYGRKVREKMIKEMKDIISAEKGFVLSSMDNMKATDIDAFRKKIKKSGSRYLVLKNRLANIALKESGIEGFSESLSENKILGIGIIKEDPVEIAKLMAEFSKNNKGFNISNAFIDGRLIDAEKVKQLASLPGREQLLGMLLCTMNAPVTGFVTVLSGVVKSLLYAIKAVKEKKESNNT